MRRLYSNNEMVSYEPRAILIISLREPHFTRGDVAERLLPLYCERPEHFVPEPIIFDELARRRGAIIGDLRKSLAIFRIRSPRANPGRSDFGWQSSGRSCFG